MPATSFGTAHVRERGGARRPSRCARSPRPSPSRCAFPSSATGGPHCNVRVVLRAPDGPAARSGRGRLWLRYPDLWLASLRQRQDRVAALTEEACDSNPRLYGVRCQATNPATGTCQEAGQVLPSRNENLLNEIIDEIVPWRQSAADK